MAKTIKEAILKSLADFKEGATAKEIYDNILSKNYFQFNREAKTPYATVQAQVGVMVKKGDSRVQREKVNKVYVYYLTQYAKHISAKNEKQPDEDETATYMERDLHPLLVTFLHAESVLAKTIYHEISKKGSEEHAKWVHPDIIGAKFVEFDSKECQSFFKAVNSKNAVELFSYELKREIKNDYELKRNFFQAVSNSSWANYGYLVAFDISESLLPELERLSNSFGIGFILLKANPYESKILYPARKKELDFQAINKLCELNKDFKKLIAQVENVITADDKYLPGSKRILKDLCDKPLASDADIDDYCKKKHIPTEGEE